MPGMARAMGATSTGAQKLLGKNWNFHLQFLKLLFCAFPTINCSAASTQRQSLTQGKLRENHKVLWQKYITVTQNGGQILWQNKNARFPYLQNLVLLTLQERRSQSERPRFRQENISQNLLEMSLSPQLAIGMWLLRKSLLSKLSQIYKLLKVLQPTPTLRNFFDGH